MNTTTPPREELLQIIDKTNNIHEVANHYNVTWRTVRCWFRWNNISLKPSKEELLKICNQLSYENQAKHFKRKV